MVECQIKSYFERRNRIMSEKGKKILIIGNGFDLAHGLPTKYIDFLEFCIRVDLLWQYGITDLNKVSSKRAFKEMWIDKWEMEDSIKDYIVNAFENRKFDGIPSQESVKIEDEILLELYELIHNNIWFRYFNDIHNKKRIKGENWIDFESEIRYVIQKIDETTDDLSADLAEIFQKMQEEEDVKFDSFVGFCVKRLGKNLLKECDISIREFRRIAFEDLEKIIRALEIYLDKFVDKIQVDNLVSEIVSLKPDFVINFNYTNTYERLYDNATVFHIHGNCDANRPVEQNNMVLGIDEYWDKDKRDSHTNFTIFKKFAQRIQKKTGIENHKYLNELNKHYEKNKERWAGNVDINTTHPDGISYVYIFGHSLDVTDKDILLEFVGAEFTSVIVYCYDKGTEGELIANTIKLIGEERLLKKVNYVPSKLDYVIQS